MSSNEELVKLSDQESFIVVDSRYFPLVFLGNFGKPTIELFDRYIELRQRKIDEALATGQKIVVIGGLDHMQPPGPMVRKYVAEVQKKDHLIEGILKQYAVVSNPLLRGAVTAILWISGRGEEGIGKFEYSSNWASAIRSGLADFAAADIDPPEIDPDTYEMPHPDSL